tara:strand:+ start:801 stop:1250 length:450 start_codon:yes stop_codon:yes gene_type:complete
MNIVNTPIDYADASICKMFTANLTLNRTGCLVMGAGSALAAKEAWPELPRFFGDWLQNDDGGLLFHAHSNIGAVHTKDNWKNKSKLHIISNSLDDLIDWMHRQKTVWGMKDLVVHMPYPGISNGGLTREEVAPYLQELPPNVVIHDLES